MQVPLTSIAASNHNVREMPGWNDKFKHDKYHNGRLNTGHVSAIRNSQSINQSIHQSIHPSINQSINQSVRM